MKKLFQHNLTCARCLTSYWFLYHIHPTHSLCGRKLGRYQEMALDAGLCCNGHGLLCNPVARLYNACFQEEVLPFDPSNGNRLHYKQIMSREALTLAPEHLHDQISQCVTLKHPVWCECHQNGELTNMTKTTEPRFSLARCCSCSY